MTNVTQISDGLSEALGIDLKLLLAGFMGGTIANKSNDKTVVVDEATLDTDM
jgi:flotillin